MFVTTLAGSVGNRGHADGIGHNVLFYEPNHIALDYLRRNLFIVDRHCVRRLNLRNFEVSTLCGSFGQDGFKDGTLSEALFRSPTGIAVDARGNIVLSDCRNHCIRFIEPARNAVSTIVSNQSRSAFESFDVFKYLDGIAVDPNNGDLLVCDCFGHGGCIRRVSGVATVGKLQIYLWVFKSILRILRLIWKPLSVTQHKNGKIISILLAVLRHIATPFYDPRQLNGMIEMVQQSSNKENNLNDNRRNSSNSYASFYYSKESSYRIRALWHSLTSVRNDSFSPSSKKRKFDVI